MTSVSYQNQNLAREAIENRMQDNWVDTPIAYQDIPYKVSAATPFVSLSTLFSGAEAVALVTDAPIRDWGIIMLEYFGLPDVGTEDILLGCGNVRALFHEEEFGGVVCQEGSVRRIGVTGDFLKYIVEIPFYYQG